MLTHVKTSLTTNLMLNNQQDSSLNIWEKSAMFAANKNGSKNITNSNYTFDNPPKEEHASCILDESIPNYLDDNES